MSDIKLKAVALVGENQINNADHLGPVCSIMGIPLQLTSEDDAETCKKYYPDIVIENPPFEELRVEYVIANYNVIFVSDLWNTTKFKALLKDLEERYQQVVSQVFPDTNYQQVLHKVFCPHGFSDKSYYLKDCVYEDITLIYGQNMLDMLKDHKVDHLLKNYVISGNYRYTYYKKHKALYDAIVAEKVLSNFHQKRPIILYAPTWDDMENASTYFDSCEQLIDLLPDHYNMVIKLHPRLEIHSSEERDNIALYYAIQGKYAQKKNVLFLENFPPVFPILAVSDIYIGDASSVGYDFLVFNKPMFFLNKFRKDPKNDKSVLLYNCGIDIIPEHYSELYKIIESNLPTDKEQFFAKRKEMWDYTFGPERPYEDIKRDILQVLSHSPAL